jgi:hypothetical protein
MLKKAYAKNIDSADRKRMKRWDDGSLHAFGNTYRSTRDAKTQFAIA